MTPRKGWPYNLRRHDCWVRALRKKKKTDFSIALGALVNQWRSNGSWVRALIERRVKYLRVKDLKHIFGRS